MINLKAEFAKNPLKICGGVIVCFGSVWLFIHNLPHHEYVQAHADKPRPKAASEAPAPAPVPAPKAVAPQPKNPAPRAPADPKQASSAPVPVEVAASTTPTVDTIYTAARLRDPFAHWGASRGTARAFSMDDFSIHKLSLRGIMRDPVSDFALFVDNDSGTGFLLRKGKLYDPKKKAVPGIAGSINFKSKVVTLTAPEGDVQVFRLGEEEKD